MFLKNFAIVSVWFFDNCMLYLDCPSRTQLHHTLSVIVMTLLKSDLEHVILITCSRVRVTNYAVITQ